MSKRCPFCKKQVKKSASECPHCRRILIEYTGNHSSVQNLSARVHKNSFLEKIKVRIAGFVKKIRNIIKNKPLLKFNKPTFNLNYLWIIPVIIFIVMTSSGNTDEQSLPENYNRLPNGIIISSLIRNSVGLGTLEIDNGTDNDAVAKLINKKKNISVSTVYIQAKSKFTITKIPDGTYELYFQTGKDWNEKENKFLFHSSFSKFTDDFEYTTTDTEYSIYRVTLNPVIGGTAATITVSENEFGKY